MHNLRLVSDGCLIDVPLSSMCSGVTSLRGIRLVLFLAELGGLECWDTNTGHTNLEAFTKENSCVVFGTRYTPLQGHVLIVSKSSHGLRT